MSFKDLFKKLISKNPKAPAATNEANHTNNMINNATKTESELATTGTSGTVKSSGTVVRGGANGITEV